MAFKSSDVSSLLREAQDDARKMGHGHVEVEGLDTVEENLRRLWGVMAKAGMARTKKVANRVLEEAKNEVPYDEGHLFGTARLIQLKDVKTGKFISLANAPAGIWAVSFGGLSRTGVQVDYAMLIHENPDNRWSFNQAEKQHKWPAAYPGPKKDHYLSDPAERARLTMLGEVKEEVVTDVKKFMTEVAQAKAVAPVSMKPRLVKRT